MITKIISSILPSILGVIDKAVPDKDKAAEIKGAISTQLLSNDSEEIKNAADVIKAEVNADSWLTKNWRPLAMVNFLMLVNLYWFGIMPPNVTEAIIVSLFSMIKIGLGGYVVSRGAEKVVKVWKES